MAARVWTGGSGDWIDATHWTTTSPDATAAPQPGDTATIASGQATLVGPEGLDGSIYDAVALDLGDAANDPARLTLDSAELEHFFSIEAQGSATIRSVGPSALTCRVTSAGAGTVLTLAGDPTLANGLLVAHGATVTAQPGARLHLAGRITAEAGITAAADSTVRNDADVRIAGALFDAEGAVAGRGRFELDDASTLRLGGSVAAGQTIDFGGATGRLQIAAPDLFRGTVTGFASGDLIDFTTVAATSAAYDAGARTLTLYDGEGVPVAALRHVDAAAGDLAVTSDGAGGTTVSYADASPREAYQIQDGDRAMRSDVVRDTMTVPGTATPITGAGITIGIISTSFDDKGTAGADAMAGYLPANPDGTSAVDIISDGSGDDEGRKMAEEIHQVAPGARIVFDAAGGSEASFAAAVTALANAGCSVIANDITFPAGPFYQVTGGLDAAVTAAVANGVNFFTSGGNFGQAFLERKFSPRPTTLPDGTAADAEVFDDGRSSERITVPANAASRIDLQWSAPYEGDGSGAPQALTLTVYGADGTPVASTSGSATGTQAVEDGVETTDLFFDLPTAAVATDYRVAVSLNGEQVSPARFKLILSLTGGTGTGAGGTIDDPAAGKGSGDERGVQLIPGVNSVGASHFANSAAFGGTPSYNEYFSNQGPGALLYDANGNPLTPPRSAGKIDFTAPDGVFVPDPTESNPNASPTAFYGTSAAAPNAAAVAALMLQANPNLTTAQVTALLEQSAIDQGLPAIQQGAGLIQADRAVALAIGASDTVSIDPTVTFAGDGTFVLTGAASSPAGVAGVSLTAMVGGVETDLGAATLNGDGTFVFDDKVGAHLQSAVTATVTDQNGVTASAGGGFDLAAGLRDCGFVARQRSDDAAGDAGSTTLFRPNGSRALEVGAAGQTFDAVPGERIDDHFAPGTTFVFDPGYGTDAIDHLRARGAGHDTISLPSADFASIADLLRHAQQTATGVVIHDPGSGDAILVAGVGKAELVQQRRDFVFHA